MFGLGSRGSVLVRVSRVTDDTSDGDSNFGPGLGELPLVFVVYVRSVLETFVFGSLKIDAFTFIPFFSLFVREIMLLTYKRPGSIPSFEKMFSENKSQNERR